MGKRKRWGLALGGLLVASVVAAGPFSRDNNIQQLSELLYNHGGTVEAAAGLSWPDGRQGTVLYVKTDSGDWFRCSDNFDPDMRYTGGLCHWIERPQGGTDR